MFMYEIMGIFVCLGFVEEDFIDFCIYVLVFLDGKVVVVLK